MSVSAIVFRVLALPRIIRQTSQCFPENRHIVLPHRLTASILPSLEFTDTHSHTSLPVGNLADFIMSTPDPVFAKPRLLFKDYRLSAVLLSFSAATCPSEGLLRIIHGKLRIFGLLGYLGLPITHAPLGHLRCHPVTCQHPSETNMRTLVIPWFVFHAHLALKSAFRHTSHTHVNLDVLRPVPTMPHFAHTRLHAPRLPSQNHSTLGLRFPSSHSIQDSTSQLHLALVP